MKITLTVLLALFLAVSMPTDVFAVEADSPKIEQAKGFIKGLAQEGIGFLSNETLDDVARKKSFEKLLNRSFDMSTIGRFAMGRYWKTATKAQRNQYQKLFKAMIIQVYSKRFGEYQGQSIEVKSARPEGKHDILVQSMIVPKNGEKIRLDWRVRPKKGRFKVVDVIVEGVSMALTQRSDFASVIQRGGGDVGVLIAYLEK